MPDAREQIKRVDNLDQKEDKKVSLVAGKEKELTETYVTKTEELLSKADELDNADPEKQKVRDGTAQLLGEIDEKTLVEKQSEFDKQINGFIDEVEGEKSGEEEFKRIEPGIEDAFASAGVQVDMSKFRDYYGELNELERAPITELEDDMIDFAAQLKAYEDMSRLISEEEINKIFNFYIRGEVEMAANERQKVEEVLKLDEYKKTLEKAEAEDAEATEKLLSATRENADGLALDAVKTKLGIAEALRPFVKLRKLADEGVSDSIFDEVKGFSFSVLSGKQDGSLEVAREFSEFPKTESELEAMKIGFEQDLKKAGEIAFIKTGKEEFRAYARAVMAERMAEAEKTNNEKLTKYAKDLNRITKVGQFSSEFNVAKRLAEELDAEVKSDSGENKEYLSKIKEYRAEAYGFLNTILQGDQVLDFQKKSMGFVQGTQLFMENSGKMIGEIQEKGEVPTEYFWQHVREYSKETLKKINGLTPTIQRFKDLAPLEGDSDEIKAINKKIEELKKLYDEIGKYVEEVRQICLIQMKIEGSGMGISGFLNVAGIIAVKITIAVAAAVAIGAAVAATGGVAAFGLTGFAAVAGNFFLSNVLIAVGTTTASHLTDFAFEGANASQGIWEDTKNFGSSTLTSLAFSAGGGVIGNVAGKAIGRGYGELLKRIPEKAAMQADKIVSGLLESAQEGFKEGGKQAFGTIWGRALHGIKEIGKETTEEIMEESLDAIGKGLVAQNDDTSQWVGFMFQLIPQVVSGGKGGIESVRVEGKIGNVSIKTSETGMSLEYSSEKDLVNFCEGRAVPVELLKRVQAGETTFTIEKNGVTIEIKKIGGQTIGGKEVSKYEGIITDSDGKIIGYDGSKPPQELADMAIAEGKQVYYDNETGDLHIGEIEIRRMETDATANAPMPNEISLGRRVKEGLKVLNEEVTRGAATTAGFLGSGQIEGFFRGLYKGVKAAVNTGGPIELETNVTKTVNVTEGSSITIEGTPLLIYESKGQVIVDFGNFKGGEGKFIILGPSQGTTISRSFLSNITGYEYTGVEGAVTIKYKGPGQGVEVTKSKDGNKMSVFEKGLTKEARFTEKLSPFTRHEFSQEHGKLSISIGDSSVECYVDTNGRIIVKIAEGKYVILNKGEKVTIGRDTLSQSIGVTDQKISGEHVTIENIGNGKYTIMDRASSNGTRVESGDLLLRYQGRANQPEITKEIIKETNFNVSKKIQIEGKTFYLGAVTTDGYRNYCIAMVDSGNGVLLPRVYYKSQSGGAWRATRGEKPDGRGDMMIDKGIKISYTQETAVAKPLNEYFEGMESSGKVINNGINVINKYFPMYKMIEVDTYEREVSPAFAKWDSPFNDFLADNYQPGRLNRGPVDSEYLGKLQYPPGLIPNFSQGPTRVVRKVHPQLSQGYDTQTGVLNGKIDPEKKITVEYYDTSIDGPRGTKVGLEVAMGFDILGRVWVESIRVKNSPTTSYGTDAWVVDPGLLVHKPLDYSEQVVSLNNSQKRTYSYEYDKKTQQYVPYYDDITPFLDNLKIIQVFRAQRGIYKP